MPWENFTTKIDNIRQDCPEWVSQKIKEELASLNEKMVMFYEIKWEWENQTVECKMDIVKSYLETIKDLERSDLKNKWSAWIMAVQIALESKWYDVGKIDGILWPNTKTAVEEFQNKNSLEEDWLPGKLTISKILEKRNLALESSNNANNWSNTQSENETEWNHLNENAEKGPKDTDIVSVSKYIPTIKLDMRYATTNNFTWQKIYENSDATLRYWTIKKLKKAQDELEKQWYSIKIWDAYRPQSAQERLRSVRPDPALVARPEKWSAHTRWNTVDITLVKSDWTEIPMPSEFDDNNKAKIDRNYSDLTEEQRNNAMILQKAMENAWFSWYEKEWWHYSDKKSYHMIRTD